VVAIVIGNRQPQLHKSRPLGLHPGRIQTVGKTAARIAHHVNGVIAVRNQIQFDLDDHMITGM